jgi:hypothetical protein
MNLDTVCRLSDREDQSGKEVIPEACNLESFKWY